MKINLLTIVLALFVCTPPSVSADSLGNKFSCTGTKLKSDGKAVTSKTAKQSLGALISSTKAQISSAPKGSTKRTKLTNKLNSLKATLASVKSCAAGTYVPEAVRALAATYSSGSWHNTTFSTTGGLSANISVTGTTLAISINIGGMMFGSLTPGPVEFQQNVGGVTLPYHFTATGTTIGDLDITISKSGGLQIEETLVPSVPSIVRATLAASFANGAFSGTFESFVAGGQLAQGTMTLSP